MNPIVIIGAGMAGYTLAREVRQLDQEREILLIAADGAESYAKPSLSNALAQGKSAEALVNAQAADMADKLRLRVLPHTRVHRIQPGERTIDTDQGVFAYSHLVLALGADPIRLLLEGKADDVISVNDLADYTRFRERLSPGGHVFILGAGLIGCEFANDLLRTGHRVTLADPAGHPLASLIPQAVGQEVRKGLAAAGAQWRLGQGAAAVKHTPGCGYAVILTGGETITADLVLSAAGLRPRTALARDAGLATHRGIEVDACLRTSNPHIFALGDCAQIEGQVRPFVQPILHAAKALAKTLTGTPTTVHFPPMPVVVKTPACPLVVLPPGGSAPGIWTMDRNESGLAARFQSSPGKLLGFALTGGRTRERAVLAKEVEAAGAIAAG